MSITMDGVELGVKISEKAAEKIKYFAEKEGLKDNVGLRVAVKGGGCSGLTYDLAITDQEKESDKIVEQYGVKVMVDKKSYIYLVGTELDFSDGLNGKGFVFENPNAKKACGCGTSFAVKRPQTSDKLKAAQMRRLFFYFWNWRLSYGFRYIS